MPYSDQNGGAMRDFLYLCKNLKKDFSGLEKVKLAVLGDTSTQFLVQALRGMGYEKGFDLQIFEADYDQIERQVFDNNSALYEFKPVITVVFKSTHKLLEKYNKLDTVSYQRFADDEMESVKNMSSALNGNLHTKVIFFNYSEIDDAVFGSFANKTAFSFLFQLRKINYELMLFASENPDFYLCDLSTIQNIVGKATFFQPSVYINSGMVLSIDVLPEVSSKTLDIIGALKGRFKKCVILDLDNTLWGGIIGDDGIENIQLGSLGIGKTFTEFQHWLKKLKNRGIILAVCSKNSEPTAKEPFEKHPDMVLRLDDIAVFVANYINKADNIIQIKNILNIGYDTMVFLDDNPFERNLVRQSLPEVCVPELPEDPADYLEYLYSLNLFETGTISAEDAERTKHYQLEAHRQSIQQLFINEDDYLQSLNMRSVAEPFNKFNAPRVAQLSQRSNQFNLRTLRYTREDIDWLILSPDHFTFAFTLEDKFGDYGLISVVVLQKEKTKTLFIENWFMSCRVLNRGMEQFVMNTILSFAKKNEYTQIKGEYAATAKNEMVRDHYENLGFIKSGNSWILKVAEYENKKCYITKNER